MNEQTAKFDLLQFADSTVIPDTNCGLHYLLVIFLSENAFPKFYTNFPQVNLANIFPINFFFH